MLTNHKAKANTALPHGRALKRRRRRRRMIEIVGEIMSLALVYCTEFLRVFF